jgi:hypothetical protein
VARRIMAGLGRPTGTRRGAWVLISTPALAPPPRRRRRPGTVGRARGSSKNAPTGAATYLYCLVHAERRPSLRGRRVAARSRPLRVIPAAATSGSSPGRRPSRTTAARRSSGILRDLEWGGRCAGPPTPAWSSTSRRRLTTLPMKLFHAVQRRGARGGPRTRGPRPGAARPRARRRLPRVGSARAPGPRAGPRRAGRRPRRRPRCAIGTRFLLAKKQELDVAREVRARAESAVEEAFEALAGRGRTRPRAPGRAPSWTAPACARRRHCWCLARQLRASSARSASGLTGLAAPAGIG